MRKEHREPPPDPSRGLRITIIGLLANTALALIKLFAGVFGHSYALTADAIESLADVFGSLVVWSGLRIAAQPPDADHPYGHGKAEPIAALVVAMMLVGAAIGISIQAIQAIITPQPPPQSFTLWVLIGVIFIKELLYRLASSIAHASQSSAVLSDAWHHRSDAITSLAALVGISIAVLGGPGWEAADAWAALFAAAVILFNAWRIARSPLQELMDVEQSHIIDDVIAIARTVPGVRDVEKVLARKSGSRYLVDMHLEVDPEMSVRDSHRLAHAVKDAVQAKLPRVMDVLVHIEPHEPED